MKWILVAILGLSATSWAQESSNASRQLQEDTIQSAQLRRESGWRLVRGAWMRSTGRIAWSDVLSTNTLAREFEIAIGVSKSLQPRLEGNRVILVEIDGTDGIWRIAVYQPRGSTANSPVRYLLADAHDLPANAAFQPVRLAIADDQIELLGRGVINQKSAQVEFDYRPGSSASMIVHMSDDNEQVDTVKVSADSLVKLRTENAELVDTYLVPLLRKVLSQNPLAPGAADVYRAFERIPADPQIAEKLNAIVDRLGSPDPQIREAANEELIALGRAGVLAGLRMDQSRLETEQKARLSDFIRSHSRGYTREGEPVQLDEAFLKQCLEDGDLAVREAARARLMRGL